MYRSANKISLIHTGQDKMEERQVHLFQNIASQKIIITDNKNGVWLSDRGDAKNIGLCLRRIPYTLII